MDSLKIQEARNKQVVTQLCLAIDTGDEGKVEKWLVFLKRNPEFSLLSSEPCGNFGNNIFHRAALSKNDKIIKKLLKISVIGINKKNLYGQTPFHFAASNENKKIMRVLLRCPNRNVNAKDNNGHTALHFAVFFEKSAIIKMLLKLFEIDINALSNEESTPLDLLMQQVDKRSGFDGNRVIYRLLKKAGAKTSSQLKVTTEENDTMEGSIKNFTANRYDKIAFFANRTQEQPLLITSSSTPRLYASSLFFMIACIILAALYCRRRFFTHRQERVEALELQASERSASALLS